MDRYQFCAPFALSLKCNCVQLFFCLRCALSWVDVVGDAVSWGMVEAPFKQYLLLLCSTVCRIRNWNISCEKGAKAFPFHPRIFTEDPFSSTWEPWPSARDDVAFSMPL